MTTATSYHQPASTVWYPTVVERNGRSDTRTHLRAPGVRYASGATCGPLFGSRKDVNVKMVLTKKIYFDDDDENELTLKLADARTAQKTSQHHVRQDHWSSFLFHGEAIPFPDKEQEQQE